MNSSIVPGINFKKALGYNDRRMSEICLFETVEPAPKGFTVTISHHNVSYNKDIFNSIVIDHGKIPVAVYINSKIYCSIDSNKDGVIDEKDVHFQLANAIFRLVEKNSTILLKNYFGKKEEDLWIG